MVSLTITTVTAIKSRHLFLFYMCLLENAVLGHALWRKRQTLETQIVQISGYTMVGIAYKIARTKYTSNSHFGNIQKTKPVSPVL